MLTVVWLLIAIVASAFDISSSSNFVAYWGQSSAGSQKSLGEYCQGSTVDAIVIAFLYQFPDTKLDISGACKTTFPNSNLLH
ncbi:Chitinase 2, partial [Coemansia erecta]